MAASSHMLRDDAARDERRNAGTPESLTVATWNVQWAPPGKRDAIHARIASLDAGVIVLTEGDVGVLPDGGYAIDGGADWGYVSPNPARRKIILWSKYPLLDPDVVGSAQEDMPWGHFVAATVETARGPIRFIGVCIPWKDAHVRTGRCDTEAWSEHLAYLRCLSGLIDQAGSAGDACVLGDFNQRIPRRRTPQHIHAALFGALSGFWISTAGDVPALSDLPVDHIAVGRRLLATGVCGLDRHEDGRSAGRLLSDHHLVAYQVGLRPAPRLVAK